MHWFLFFCVEPLLGSDVVFGSGIVKELTLISFLSVERDGEL